MPSTARQRLPAAAATQPAAPSPSAGRDPIADLERLVALHERVALTAEEFSAAKRSLLGM